MSERSVEFSHPKLLRFEVLKRIVELHSWEENPSGYEQKETITPEEYGKIKSQLADQFQKRVKNSSLASSEREVTDMDLELAHEIILSLAGIEERAIPDEKRRPWNPSCLEHSLQVEAFAWALTEAVNEHRESEIDPNRRRVKGLMHDIGRAASHHPVIHGLAGREILINLGFGADFRTTALAHLEAGVGPYVIGVTKDTWPEISANPELLERKVEELSIEEIIIGLADIGKKGVKQSDGNFINMIADPVEGLVPSAKRRLTTTAGEPSDTTLMDLSDENPETRKKAMTTLENMGVDSKNSNLMAMYFGWMGAMKRRLEREYEIQFEGEDGVIVKAQEYWEELQKKYKFPTS